MPGCVEQLPQLFVGKTDRQLAPAISRSLNREERGNNWDNCSTYCSFLPGKVNDEIVHP